MSQHPTTERPKPCVLDSLWITEFAFLPQMATNHLSAFIEGESKIGNSKSTRFLSLFLSRILGWILLALHHAFLLKSSHKGKMDSYCARLHGSCRKTGTIFQLFIFAIMYKKIEEIIVSIKSSSIDVSPFTLRLMCSWAISSQQDFVEQLFSNKAKNFFTCISEGCYSLA